MYRQRKVSAIIVAAGSSTRMGFDKLLFEWEGVPVLRRSVAALDQHPYIDNLVVVAGQNLSQVEALFHQNPTQKPLDIVVVAGGGTRTDSVAAGVIACADASLVAIHDGARPFVSQEIITKTIEAAADYGAATPAIRVKDTIKRAQNGLVVETLPREQLCAVQTPQVFDRPTFARVLAATPPDSRAQLTDDCMVMERAGIPVRLVEGEQGNFKITTPEDLPQTTPYIQQQQPPGQFGMANKAAFAGAAPMAAPPLPRMGHGYDVHKLVPGRKLILGGVEIPYHNGLLGHSDADVLLHAISDALLGAAALGDIGKHFPDTNTEYKNADSLVLLQRVGQLVLQKGFHVGNIDATMVCQAPKLRGHIDAMRENIAGALHISMENVSVKATTEEGLGFTGAGLGIAAHCVAVLAPANY